MRFSKATGTQTRAKHRSFVVQNGHQGCVEVILLLKRRWDPCELPFGNAGQIYGQGAKPNNMFRGRLTPAPIAHNIPNILAQIQLHNRGTGELPSRPQLPTNYFQMKVSARTTPKGEIQPTPK